MMSWRQLGKSDSYSDCRPLYCLCTLFIPAAAFKCVGCLSASDACARLFLAFFFLSFFFKRNANLKPGLHCTVWYLLLSLLCRLIRLLEDIELWLRVSLKNGKMTTLICLLENKPSIEDELRWWMQLLFGLIKRETASASASLLLQAAANAACKLSWEIFPF